MSASESSVRERTKDVYIGVFVIHLRSHTVSDPKCIDPMSQISSLEISREAQYDLFLVLEMIEMCRLLTVSLSA